MNKIGAMVRYEVLMAWRRRSLPILWLLLLVGVVGMALLITSANQTGKSLAEIMAQGSNLPFWKINSLALINLMIAGTLIYSVGITLLMAEIIPLDRQFKLRELLDTLPVSRAGYLGGKVLGACGGVALGWLMMGGACAAGLFLIFGAYDLRVFVVLWLVMVLPASLLAAAISVLAAALVGSRRAAVVCGLIALPFVILLAGQSATATVDFGGLIEPIYAVTMPTAPSTTRIVSQAVRALAVDGLVVVSLWVFVWAWSRAREAR